MFEEWKDIVEFEGLYQISNHGNFRKHPDKQGKCRKNPKPLGRAKQLNRWGYEYIDLCKNNQKSKKTVHQVVAAAFIADFTYGMIVNHKDGNKLNNHITNLELSDYVHNNIHAHSMNLMPKPGKSQYHNVSHVLDKRHKNPKYVYRASVKINSKCHIIGLFKQEIDAAKAVDTFLDSIGDTVRKRNFS